MTDYLLCCFYFNRESNQQNGKFSIRHIDKSMIGLPTNFQHCAHIGCSDVLSNSLPISNFNSSSIIETQMQSKGVFSLPNQQINQQQSLVSHLKLIDLNTS